PSAPRASDVLARINRWLSGKGEVASDGNTITLRDGRKARLERTLLTSLRGDLTEVSLTEPTQDGGKFRTSIMVAESDATLAVSVELGAATSLMAPVHVEAYCPIIIRELLSLNIAWHYQRDRVTSLPAEFSGRSGGENFVSLAWNRERSIPLVVVSQDDQQVL